MSKKKTSTVTKPTERKGLSKKIRFEVLKRDSFKCQYCGASAPEVVLQIDHINPVSGGGEDDLWNLVTSCHSCNAGKSDRQLSDNAVLAKSKRQLDELQERREQIEMLMEWKTGLRTLADETLDHVCDMCSRHMLNQFRPSPQTRHNLGALLNKCGLEILLESMNVAASQYIRLDNDAKVVRESACTFLEKIGAICTIKHRSKNEPGGEQIYRIRGLLAHRLKERGALYYEPYRALRRLRECVSAGIDPHALYEAVSHCECWSQFMNETQNLLDEIDGSACG